jgi:putative transposase
VIFAGIADWADSGEYGVVFMCAQLGVSTAGYYAWRGRAPSARATEDAALTAEIIAAHLALHGNPGVRRMWAHLTAVGHRISAKRVHRLMQAAGLQGRHSKQWKVTTVAGDNPAPAPDLIGRNFTATEANTRWCGDITYIKTWDGWAYLATVIDLHSRALVGWALDTHMRTSLVTEALSMALRRRQPAGGVIVGREQSRRSDRGGISATVTRSG